MGWFSRVSLATDGAISELKRADSVVSSALARRSILGDYRKEVNQA
jgi:hypothetical protein